MTIEEAFLAALEHEARVRDQFTRAADATSGEPEAFFRLMAREEQGHIDFLNHALDRWRSRGEIAPADGVRTAVPTADWLRESGARLDRAAGNPERHYALEHLYRALEMEEEVSRQYRKLVDAVDDPAAAALFRRFLEIEDGHTALVQAEIDYTTRTGEFYGIQEFTLDG